MFGISPTENPLLEEIENKFRDEFDYYVNRWKDFRIQDMKRDMIKYFYSINQENWPRLLSKRFELLESEFNNHCNGNLYASPYCLYGIVLHYEAYEELSEISEPLTRDVIFCHTQNTTLERSPMYREMFYLNYIKSMICGLSFSEMQNIKALKMAENEARSEAIRKAIEYIRPIFAEEFLSTEITPQKMEENFKNILNIDEVKNLMCVNDLKKFKDFNMRMVLNIVGLLIDNGYFQPRTAKKINERLQKNHPEHGQRKDEILYYKNGSTYSYIQKYGLIPIIEKRFPKR